MDQGYSKVYTAKPLQGCLWFHHTHFPKIVFEGKEECFGVFVFHKWWKQKASGAVALGLRNAYILKNRVIKHQFLFESIIQDIATLNSVRFCFIPLPPLWVGIGDILRSRNLIRSQLFNIGVSGRNCLQSSDQINPIHH